MIQVYHSVLVRVGVRVLVPFIQVYALYVLFHGHYSAGGGFQAGTMLAASLILDVLSYGPRAHQRRLTERRALRLGALGVAIYAGIGVISLFLKGNFLDYSLLPLPMADALRRTYGILGVEVGVCIAIMAILVLIFYNLVIPEEDRVLEGP